MTYDDRLHEAFANDTILRIDIRAMAIDIMAGEPPEPPLRYRGHVVECFRRAAGDPHFPGTFAYLVDGEYPVSAFDTVQGATSAISQIDYLIDIFDNVNEPALKGIR